MERTISQEDRIKRAEEIYYRKKQNLNSSRATINLNSKKEYKLLKKLVTQIIVCVGIYFIIYGVQANTDSFSVDSIKYIKNTLGYDIDLKKWANEGQKYLSALYSQEIKKDELPEETLEEESEDSKEVVEDESVVCHFGSLAEAARFYGIQMQSVVWRIKHKVEVNGQRLRFDRIQYRRRWGHFPSFQD